MDKTKIEWADATWNPVTGCLHGCEYCYARRIAERFNGYFGTGGLHELAEPIRDAWRDEDTGERVTGRKEPYPYGFAPTFHRYRLNIPERWTKPRTIFVCSMADLFGEWVPLRWIMDVIDACRKAPQHRYSFLTKNPKRYRYLDYMGVLPHEDNFWYGTSITSVASILKERPYNGSFGTPFNTFWSAEPLHGALQLPFMPLYIHPPKWLIIGAETGNRKDKVRPCEGWISEIVDYCDRRGIPVFMKDSLIPIVDAAKYRRAFPWTE